MSTLELTDNGVRFDRDENPEADHRTYYLRVPIRGSFFWDAGDSRRSDVLRSAKSALLTELTTLPGIQSFYLHEGYEIKANKATAWSWDDLHYRLTTAIDIHNKTAEFPDYLEAEEPRYESELPAYDESLEDE